MTDHDIDDYLAAPCCPGAITALAEELQRLPTRKRPPKWERPRSKPNHVMDYSKLQPIGPSEDTNETV